jgi:exopolyphosphatase/guanosine-5'-triphosphate,3'-diphosphate pyrophosphatase
MVMMQPVQRTAVIDMGSNSFRLVVYGWEPGRSWQHVDEIREAVRVSAGMAAKGAIKRGRFKYAVNTAVVFASFCQAAGIDEVFPVATSAIRDASNQAELLKEFKEHAGLDVRVLSGED